MTGAPFIKTKFMQVLEHRINEPMEQHLRRRYAAGETQREIARDLGINGATISRWMAQMGLEPVYGPKRTATAERFWARVDRSDPDGCWPFRGTLNNRGYAMTNVTGHETRLAHRLAYELTNGPTKSQLDHLCRNRQCVNPAHLEPVTASENLRRARVAKEAA